MGELVIKDNEFIRVEKYINQLVAELARLCNQYVKYTMSIYEDGLEDSAMLEVIYEKMKPIGMIYMIVQQEKMHHGEALETMDFLDQKIKNYISRIDEIDFILY